MKLELHKAYRLNNGVKAIAVDFCGSRKLFTLFNTDKYSWFFYEVDGTYGGGTPDYPLSVREEWSEPKKAAKKEGK